MSGNASVDGKDLISCNLFSCEEVYDSMTVLSGLTASDRFEICLVAAGAGIHRVLDQEIPCKKGDICVIPPDIPHGYFLADKKDSLMLRQIQFKLSDWFSGKTLKQKSPDYCYGVFNSCRTIAYATLNSFMLNKVDALYDYIEYEVHEQKAQWQELIRGYLINLLVSIARYVNSAIKNVSFVTTREWDVVSAAMHIVKEEYSNPGMRLEDIAKRLYISQSQLSRVFKKITGQPFSDYLRDVRLNHVCEQLQRQEQNVEVIAWDCGFRDIPTFYKNFLAKTQMTPKEYRQTITLSDHKSEEYKKLLKGEKIMSILNDISTNLQMGKAKAVKELVQQALNEGVKPAEILSEGLLAGMNVIGEKFKNNEVYVPEVLVAARAMNMGTQILKPHLQDSGITSAGKICIGTVQGDLHDIGKNLVKMMMEGKGIEVVDLGTDVAPETFVQTAIEQNCQVICCSALLTTTMSVMAEVVKAAEAAGIRDKVKIMIGGAPVSESFCKEIGADCYTVDAASAADAAVEFCKA